MPYVVTCFCSVELLTSAADGVMMLASDALACAEGGNIVMVIESLTSRLLFSSFVILAGWGDWAEKSLGTDGERDHKLCADVG